MPLTVPDPEALAKHIEKLVTTQGMTHMEAVLHVCEQRDVAPEDIAKFLSTKIKNCIANDAAKLHLMQKPASLPFDEE